MTAQSKPSGTDGLMRAMGWPATLRTPLGDALRVIRLGFCKSGWVSGRYQHISVARRVADRKRTLEHARSSRAEPPWLPDEGRESPREEWMSWRTHMFRYAYPGWMRHHAKRHALSSTLFYCFRRRELDLWGKPWDQRDDQSARNASDAALSAQEEH